MRTPLLQAALDLARQGRSIIPVRRDKTPLVEWKPYQQQRATEEQIEKWFGSEPAWGLAIVTGAISGCVVLDIDGQKGYDALAAHEFPLPPTLTVQTPRGGRHFYFEAPGLKTKNFAGGMKAYPLPQVDFRGDGGYAVCPPTPGYSYVEHRPLAPMPDWLRALVIPGWNLLQEAIATATVGTRNDVGFKLACKSRDAGITKEQAEPLLRAYVDAVRDRGIPSYEAGEALASLESSYTHPPRSSRPGGQSTGPDDFALQQLAAMPRLDYDRERDAAASRLGVRVSTLDVEVAQRRSPANGRESRQGCEPMLRDIEPAAEPVDGTGLLDALTATLCQYVVLPPHGAMALALWVLRTHAHDAFDVNPRLAFISPLPRCGKTTLLELLAHLTPRALLASNVTPATVFRIIEAAKPTLLVDEFDSFKNKDEELRGIINSGHRRAAAFVLRCVGEEHEPKPFSTWCPMVFASIGSLPDTLQDRSIIIRMRRRAPSERVARLRWSGKPGEALRESLTVLARACARWVADHSDALQVSDPVIPESLNDRAADNWSPLLTIADTIGGTWPERARVAAIALSGVREGEGESIKVEILNDIRTQFNGLKTDRLTSKELCERLARMEERPWGSWKRGQPITAAQLARLLRLFEIRSKDFKQQDKSVLKGYERQSFEDAWDRYLPPVDSSALSRDGATSRPQRGDQPLSASATEPSGSVSEKRSNPAPDARGRAVAGENGRNGQEDGRKLHPRLAALQTMWRDVSPQYENGGVNNGENPSKSKHKAR